MRDLCCAIAIAVAALPAGAQSPPPAQSAPAPTTQRSVFRVATRLVQVNVVVHDQHGAPVTDLKKEDFTVLERGKPQSISFFAMESADKLSRPAASLPPHIFSNVFAERAGVPTSITVVLLDLLNTSWVDQQYARRGLMTFLRQVQPQDRIGIYALGAHSLTLLHDYTTDASSLVARLKADDGELPSVLDRVRQPRPRRQIAVGGLREPQIGVQQPVEQQHQEGHQHHEDRHAAQVGV